MLNDIKLPDWDDISKLIGVIEDLNREVLLADAKYDFERARKIKKEMSIDNTKITQVNAVIDADEELYEIKKNLAVYRSRLKKAELEMTMIKMQVEIYRTESANIRNASIS